MFTIDASVSATVNYNYTDIQPKLTYYSKFNAHILVKFSHFQWQRNMIFWCNFSLKYIYLWSGF